MAEASVTVVGAGVTGSGNAGELAYFNSPVGITGVPNSGVNGATGAITIGAAVGITGQLNVTGAVIATGNLQSTGGRIIASGSVVAFSLISIQGNLTTNAGAGRQLDVTGTVIAAANNDLVNFARVSGAVTPGAFTGLSFVGLEIVNVNTSTWTAPADPVALLIDNINGTGATNAYFIKLGTVSGATNNILISHTNFSVLQSGLITSAGGVRLTAGALRIDTGGSTTISTGTGTIKMSTVNNANSAVWIPVNYNGTTYFVPGFTTNAP